MLGAEPRCGDPPHGDRRKLVGVMEMFHVLVLMVGIWVVTVITIPSTIHLMCYFVICKLHLNKDAKTPYASLISFQLGACSRKSGEWLTQSVSPLMGGLDAHGVHHFRNILCRWELLLLGCAHSPSVWDSPVPSRVFALMFTALFYTQLLPVWMTSRVAAALSWPLT